MVILAPEQGSRTTLTPDPTGTILQAPWLAGGAAASGVASFLRRQAEAVAAAAAAAAAALQQKAVQDAAALTARVQPVAVLPRDAPPSSTLVAKVALLPPLAPLPAPPARPGTVAPGIGAAGGGILLLVAMAVLSGTRRR